MGCIPLLHRGSVDPGSFSRDKVILQRPDQQGIAVLCGCQLPRDDLIKIGIDGKVELALGPATLAAMLLTLPVTGTEYLQVSGVDHHVDWTGC